MLELESVGTDNADADGLDVNIAHMLIKRLDGRTLVLAESCTAGCAADMLASIPGASNVFWGSFVSYTAEAKTAMLGIDKKRLDKYGLVSKETAVDMANGALKKSDTFIAGAVTGITGPDGDGSAVPVGTVWIAVAVRARTTEAKLFHFSGSRNEIRFQAALALLKELYNTLDKAD